MIYKFVTDNATARKVFEIYEPWPNVDNLLLRVDLHGIIHKHNLHKGQLQEIKRFFTEREEAYRQILKDLEEKMMPGAESLTSRRHELDELKGLLAVLDRTIATLEETK